MAETAKKPDRRVEKTREVIRQAFVDVVREKGLAGATVRAVTARANVSRGTFYAHYADKFELVDAIVRAEFRKAVSAVPLAAGWNRATLSVLVQTVLAFFKSVYQRHHRARDLAPRLEQAIQAELNQVVLALLPTGNNSAGRPRLPLETLAQLISWTIYGAAIQWSQNSAGVALDDMTQAVVGLIMDGVGRSA